MPKRKRQVEVKQPKPHVEVVNEEDTDLSQDSDVIWIQCENKSCLKWRQVSHQEAEEVGEGSWYCWMNKDDNLNNCNIPERKAKIGRGMKFVYSLLPLGEVVMAKMPGYPLWPGLLTADPTCGEYYDALMDKEEEPIQYHVEFLGDQHSRAWVVPRSVHPYNNVSEQEKMIPLSGKMPSKLQTYYRSALKEAKSLLPLTTKRRLQLSNHFKVLPNASPVKVASAEDSKKGVPVSQTKKETACPHIIPSHDINIGFKSEKQCCDMSESEEECNSYVIKKPRRRHSCLKSEETDTDTDEKAFSPDEDKFFLKVKDVLQQRGLPAPKHPTWRGQCISLLALYNAVQQYGGFELVCKSKKWSKIYSSLVSSSGHAMSGTVRLFYQRHLLPYEMFIKRPHLSSDMESVTSPPDTTVSSTCQHSPDPRMGHCSPGSEGEQKVPDMRSSEARHPPRVSDEPTPITAGPVDDCVPSSNPDSPVSQSHGCLLSTSDSEDEEDDDVSLECNAAQRELQQLEQLLSSIEPSLYPPQCTTESQEKRRHTNVSHSTSPSLVHKKEDVLKTLEEMTKIEGAIAELDTMVSLELENL